MKTQTRKSPFRPLVILSFLILVVVGIVATTVFAHEAPCPYCKLTLMQNTDKIDNETVLMYGNKRIEYRCIYCVLADQGKYKGDLIVNAPSETKGSPVVLKRTAGQWTAPDSTVFLNVFKRHKTCATESRAFSSKSALEVYAKANGIEDAKALTLKEELAEAAKKK